MSGTVEIDETYIGGTAIRRFQKTPKVRAPKEMVFALRERGTKEKAGRVRFFHVPNGKRATLEPIIKEHIAANVTRINTDSSAVYDFAIHETFNSRHRTVNHSYAVGCARIEDSHEYGGVVILTAQARHHRQLPPRLDKASPPLSDRV
jgi:hypothetical protein